MKSTFAASALLSFFALASAAPTPNGQGMQMGPPRRSSSGSTVIYPMMTSTYKTWSGDTTDGTTFGLVQCESGRSSPIATYMTFDIPPETASKRCQFNFRLSNSATVTGTGQAEVFTWLDSLNYKDGTWAGHIQAATGAVVSLAPIDCPAGHKYTVRLAQTAEDDLIKWDVYTEGPEIVVIS